MALTDGLTHLFSMEVGGVENNLSPTPIAPLSLTLSVTEPAIIPGKVGNGRDFVDKNRTMSDVAFIFPPGVGPIDGTIAAWVRYDSLNGSSFGRREQSIIMTGSAAVDNLIHYVFAADGTTDRMFFRVNPTSQVAVEVQSTTFGTLTVGQWHLVVALLDGTGGTIGISVDNSAIDTAAWDGSLFTSGTPGTVFGIANNFASYETLGDMDEVAAWNRVLTPAEIAELWNGGAGVNILTAGPPVTGLLANLIHAWEMDEASGDCIDRVGVDDLDIVQGTDSPGVAGRVDGARDFSGTMFARQVASKIGLESVDAYSVALWVKTTAIIAGNKRLWTTFQGTGRPQQCAIGSTNRIFVLQRYDVASGTDVVAPADRAMLVDVWYHHVYTWERNAQNHLYQNAELIDSNTTPDEATGLLSTPTWSIAANLTGNERTEAIIDQVWVWNRAITATEVNTLWNGGSGVRFDEIPTSSAGSTQTAYRRRRRSH